jgi:hypothetical protein
LIPSSLARDHAGSNGAGGTSACTSAVDTALANAGINIVLSGVRVPRMNAIMEHRSKPATTNCWT